MAYQLQADKKFLELEAKGAGVFLDPSGFGQITSILNTGAVGTATPRHIEFAARMDF